jgi:hypothetical protein
MVGERAWLAAITVVAVGVLVGAVTALAGARVLAAGASVRHSRKVHHRSTGPARCAKSLRAKHSHSPNGHSRRTANHRKSTKCPVTHVKSGKPPVGAPNQPSTPLGIALAGAGNPLAPTLPSTPEPPVELAPPPPPPPGSPVNSSPPSVAGTATVGQQLTAGPGKWSGAAPIAYASQWQDCETSGASCSNISGATVSTYTLAPSDVNHLVRVVVTASNASGETSAKSTGVGPVTAPPPTAAFAYSASPVAGQPITFDGSGSSCPDGPCTYEWSDDGSKTRPIKPLWPLGGGRVLVYTFSKPGTKFIRLVVADAKGQAATVEHNVVVEAVPPPPSAPSNTAPPAISGSAQVGQTLSASSGTWSGTAPIAYTYQWQDCNEAGGSCASISGATAGAHTLSEADAGHTIRVVVTATNSAGSAPQASAPTSVVVPKESGVSCTATVTPSMSAIAIASAIVSAANASTICMAAGSYPLITINGATHTSYVTLRPTAGATPTVAGIKIADSSYLRIEGLHMSEGINAQDNTSGVSHDLQFIDNTFENTIYGIAIDGNTAPIAHVLVEGNYFHHLDFPGTCAEGAGYAGGQGVSNFYGDGVTVAHNTFKEISWHFIQGGGGELGMTVDHNLFEGPIPPAHLECTHLDVWQIWTGGENDAFTNNIVRGEPGKPVAIIPLIFETGAGGGECADALHNTTITNNLFIDSAASYVAEIFTTTNLTYSHNTVVGGQYGTFLDRSETCGPGTNLTAEHNIAVGTEGGYRFIVGECTGACSFEYNVSDDATAGTAGAKHDLTNWAPSWESTTYLHAGYYIPTGLPFTAGYEGGGGL